MTLTALLVATATLGGLLGGFFGASRALRGRDRPGASDLEALADALSRAIDGLGDSLRDSRPAVDQEIIGGLIHRITQLEALGATLPATWEDWHEKINAAAHRRERAAQRAEKAARERDELDDEDQVAGWAPQGVAADAADGMQPVHAEVGVGAGEDSDARRERIRAIARQIKYGA